MAEKKEQIRIEADFDASKLDLKSKAALDKLQQSTEKVSQSVKKTANSFNDLSNKINKAGQTTQNATNNIVRNLKNVERQAGKTGNALNRMGQGGPHGNTQTLGPSGSMGMGADAMLLGSMLGRGKGKDLGLKELASNKALANNILQARKYIDENASFLGLKLYGKRCKGKDLALKDQIFYHDEVVPRSAAYIYHIPKEYQNLLTANANSNEFKSAMTQLQNAQQYGTALKAPAIDPNSFRGKWNQMDFGGKMGALGMAGMLMAPMVGSVAKGLGASESGANLAQNLFSGIIGGATGGSVLGPLGSAGGALVGAATALTNAALEQKKAAEMIIASYKQNKEENQKTFDHYKSNKYRNEFYGRQKAMLDKAINDKDFDRAKAIINRRIEDRKKVRDDLFGQISKNTTGIHREYDPNKADWKIDPGLVTRLRGKGDFVLHSEDQYHLLQKGIATYLPDSYDIKGLKNGVAVMQEIDAELDNLRKELEKLAEAETAEAAAAAAEAARIKQEEEERQAEEKRKKHDKLTEEGDAWTSMASLMDKMAGNVTSNGESAKGRLSGYRLTDSLTSMGAGKGYYGQMNGVANEVSRISKAVNKAVDLIDKFKALFESYAADKYKDAATYA